MLELWTSEACNYCKALKKFLEDNKIEHIEKVLDRDFNVGDLITETSRRGNPTMSFPILINDTVCWTTKHFMKNGQLDYVWLKEQLC